MIFEQQKVNNIWDNGIKIRQKSIVSVIKIYI